jgi:hypothetical protein
MVDMDMDLNTPNILILTERVILASVLLLMLSLRLIYRTLQMDMVSFLILNFDLSFNVFLRSLLMLKRILAYFSGFGILTKM